ncbi:MAG: transporter permease iron, partial [Eubacterium sp.]
MLLLLIKSFNVNGAFSFSNYRTVVSGIGFSQTLVNSFTVSLCSALVTTIIAFILAYTINNTNIPLI